MARGKPGIISVGKRHEWPRSEWGWADWRDEERFEARLSEREREMLLGLPPPGPQVSPSFFTTPKERRSAYVDELLGRLGVSGRRR